MQKKQCEYADVHGEKKNRRKVGLLWYQSGIQIGLLLHKKLYLKQNYGHLSMVQLLYSNQCSSATKHGKICINHVDTTLKEIFTGYFVSQLSRDCILQICKEYVLKEPQRMIRFHFLQNTDFYQVSLIQILQLCNFEEDYSCESMYRINVKRNRYGEATKGVKMVVVRLKR